MKAITCILALCAVIVTGCKSGEGGESYDFTPIDRSSQTATADDSRTSLDWAGIYEGTTPCADCEGIKTTLRLNNDETYVMSQTYLKSGEDEVTYKNSGDFRWDTGSEIIIESDDGLRIRFQVGENEVTMLDMRGNVVTGELANFYVLKKQ